jgi:Ca-activated chloride channel family protein
MKKIILFPALTLLSILFVTVVNAQSNKIKGHISAGQAAELTIYKVFPDSFPNVSVVFKAETKSGNPVWGLNKDNINVREDSQLCKVVSIERLSANKAISIGIVIDHSGSMNDDAGQIDSLLGGKELKHDKNGNIVYPKGYISPINNAKMAVKRFIKSFNVQKDFISFVGFSDEVDKKCKLTHDTSKVDALIDSMQAIGGTALYDAMLVAVKQVKKVKGLKALVVLTDGQDNESKAVYRKVINKANDENIPIYIIGLGDADKDTLKLIANSTKGEFYYTHSAASLNIVYDRIRKNLQAFYDVVYASSNFSADDTMRSVEVSFDIKDITLHTQPLTTNFTSSILANAPQPEQVAAKDTTTDKVPEEVAEYVEKKETHKEYYIYGGVALLAVVAGGGLLYKYSRQSKTQNDKKEDNNTNNPVIVSLFPNPTVGPISVQCTNASAGNLVILNLIGQPMRTIEVAGNTVHTDLSNLPDGEYFAFIQANGVQSNTMKFIVKK